MSYDFYKIMHFLGLFMTFSALGGQIVQSLNGADAKQLPGRRWTAMFHGIGLLLVLVGGFGLYQKLNVSGFPTWIIGKLAIWLILGGLSALIARKRSLAAWIWIIALVLGVVAAYLARTKPL